MYGAGRSRITHPFATLTQEQAPGIPFDLHVLSTPPEPESNPPQKNLVKRHRHDDSRNKKIDDRLIRKGASHKNLAAV